MYQGALNAGNNMRWKNVIFDLDGTLFDTSPGILRGIRRALRECGAEVGSDRELHKFIGPPLNTSFRDFCGMTEEKADRAKKLYRAYYREHGVYECSPYEGAEECLRRLRKAGAKTAVATSKPIFFAEQILKRFGFYGLFDVVCGAESDERSGKAEIVRRALDGLSAVRADTVMVGDRKYDILGAAECGIPCIALDTGFADEFEYENAGAAYVVKNYRQLQDLLFGKD